MQKCENCLVPKPDVKEYTMNYPHGYIVKICNRCARTEMKGKVERVKQYK